MGLDLYCNGKSEKCGSYNMVQTIRYLLLVGLKYYLETEHMDKEEEIDYIVSLLGKSNQVVYEKYCSVKNSKLKVLGVYGLLPFIFHSDCDGRLSSYEAKIFMDAWEKTKEYMDDSLKYYNDEFYLQDIFEESIESDEEICFC